MKRSETSMARTVNRRRFLKGGALMAGMVSAGPGLLSTDVFAADRDRDRGDDDHGITTGDIAILRFLAAAEFIETDLWQQYAELAGENAPESGYRSAIEVLDEDMPQYISDNTDDEMNHAAFINAYLKSKGAQPVDLDPFRTLQGSKATGAKQVGRLTNLFRLTVDTSWWTRYRSTQNPDFGAQFPQAIPSLAVGQHPAIPKDDAESGSPDNITNHMQAVANTAAFHFGFIEQGGTSLYPSLAQRVTNIQVLRVLLSIGPTESMHFQTWHDKAGNAPAVTDGALVFPDLGAGQFANNELFQTNLIMPEPCDFLRKTYPRCSVVRPTKTAGAAMNAAGALVADGLFIGQSKEFFEALRDLASDADDARRNES